MFFFFETTYIKFFFFIIVVYVGWWQKVTFENFSWEKRKFLVFFQKKINYGKNCFEKKKFHRKNTPRSLRLFVHCFFCWERQKLSEREKEREWKIEREKMNMFSYRFSLHFSFFSFQLKKKKIKMENFLF